MTESFTVLATFEVETKDYRVQYGPPTWATCMVLPRGSEPMTWDVYERAVEYAQLIKEQRNVATRVILVTKST